MSRDARAVARTLSAIRARVKEMAVELGSDERRSRVGLAAFRVMRVRIASMMALSMIGESLTQGAFQKAYNKAGRLNSSHRDSLPKAFWDLYEE